MASRWLRANPWLDLCRIDRLQNLTPGVRWQFRTFSSSRIAAIPSYHCQHCAFPLLLQNLFKSPECRTCSRIAHPCCSGRSIRSARFAEFHEQLPFRQSACVAPFPAAELALSLCRMALVGRPTTGPAELAEQPALIFPQIHCKHFLP